MSYIGSYIQKLRKKIGNDHILMPGSVVIVENQKEVIYDLIINDDNNNDCNNFEGTIKTNIKNNYDFD